MPEKLYGILAKKQLAILVGNKSIEGFLFNKSVIIWGVSPQPSIKEVIKKLKNLCYPYNIDPMLLEILDFRTDVVQFYKINKIIDINKYMILI